VQAAGPQGRQLAELLLPRLQRWSQHDAPKHLPHPGGGPSPAAHERERGDSHPGQADEVAVEC